jgi:hypothetical protein
LDADGFVVIDWRKRFAVVVDFRYYDKDWLVRAGALPCELHQFHIGAAEFEVAVAAGGDDDLDDVSGRGYDEHVSIGQFDAAARS